MRSLCALLASTLFMLCFGAVSVGALTLLLRVDWSEGPPGAAALVCFGLSDAVQSFLGGALCARIARRQREVVVLAAFVLLGGGLTAWWLDGWDDEPPFFPHWMLWGEPFVDSFAVLVGGRLLAHRTGPGRAESGGRAGDVTAPLAP